MSQQSGTTNNSLPQNVNLFPPPPIFAEGYTSDNIAKGLVLPPPPVPTKFEVFGETFDLEGALLPSLTDTGCQQLYSASGNWRSELLKLNRSLVAAFLDLVEVLIRCPDNEERIEKIETIRTLFINIHHLINEYRPVQARDTLRQLIKHQNLEITAKKLNKYTETGTAALETLNNALRNFTFDETIPKPPFNCFEDDEEAMEIGDRKIISPPIVQTSTTTTKLPLPKSVELSTGVRLMRRDIGGATQILSKFQFF
uniref:Mediator of RNA polymerase II transcription subunit 7 n=1 Tax=Meloidogyne hapla TaxID=6305 RepID=A0A1I8B289_MELHA